MTKLLIKLFIKDSDNVGDSSVRQKYGYLGSCTGIALNILLFVGKLIAGLISGAISVMADAFNNLSDAGSSVMSLVGFKMAAKAADEDHPFGHGRMEYISGLVISFIVMLMGVELGKSSVSKIFAGEKLAFSKLTLGILICSVAVKLWMGWFYKSLGNKINSTALRASAADSLSDCAATGAVIIAMLISSLTGVNIDGYVGVLVAVFIFWSGFNTCRDSVSPLLGSKPDKEFVQEIIDTAMSYPNIIGIHDLLVHDYGVGNSVISFHAEVPCEMNFMAAHELIDSVEEDMKKKYKCAVSIHMDPVADNDEETNAAKQVAIEVAKSIDERLSIHDFRMTKGENRANLIFDLVIPFDFCLSDDEVIDKVSRRLSEFDSRYNAVINVDKGSF
ncbi:cation diffusion facilitator family transporter [Ruminococcus sp.]|uniref:cation diffusion facilitator family transporter n=1 Tax=Ruminococcus sp. TaxID=41978 RepID=UPI0025FBC34A|nr:cation diffusion facilitator family transporter [Ruminococcus sp.]